MKYFPRSAICALVALSLVGSAFAFQVPYRGRKQVNRVQNSHPGRVNQLPPALKKLIANAEKLSYTGERQVRIKVKKELTTHIEEVTKSGARTRIDFPANSPFAGQILLTIKGQRQHYFPKRGVVKVMPGFKDETLEGLLSRPQALQPGQIRTQDGGMVAGMRTTQIDLFDRQNRIRQQLWVDPRNGALLARTGYGPDGQVVASFEFLSINYHPQISPGLFSLPKEVKIVTPETQIKKIARTLKITPFRLATSTGLELLSVSRITLKGQPVLMEVYRGPKGRLSFFEVDSVLSGESYNPGQGNVHSAKRVMGQETIFLVGRYPINWLQTTLQSVVRV